MPMPVYIGTEADRLGSLDSLVPTPVSGVGGPGRVVGLNVSVAKEPPLHLDQLILGQYHGASMF